MAAEKIYGRNVKSNTMLRQGMLDELEHLKNAESLLNEAAKRLKNIKPIDYFQNEMLFCNRMLLRIHAKTNMALVRAIRYIYKTTKQ